MLPKQAVGDDLSLSNTIFNCQSHLQSLNGVNLERSNVLRWFQTLCEHLTQIIALIGSCHNKNTKKITAWSQNTWLLYCTQMLASLSLLINVFVQEEEINTIIIEARNCVQKQIVCCLEGIEVAMKYKQSLSDPCGNFVKWMDAALDTISEINMQDESTKISEVYKETQEVFEEVLSHAMSIAQVSLDEDKKTIHGGCQSVLSMLSSLHRELNNATINAAMVTLFIDSASDKLCNLEKKVNTAVLKLCLKAFSQFTTPLEKIREFCSNSSNKNHMEDLDGLIADFDLHVDRMMQIGLFAVSCSSDLARGIKLRSCLASLEALESELVPALTSVLLDNSIQNVNCAKLLTDHWLNQANCLQQLIYLIVDPFAFCQIIYEEAHECVDLLSASIEKKIFIEQNDVKDFVSIARVLETFLEKAQTEFTETETIKMQPKLQDFHNVLQEVESASKILLNDNHICFNNCKRVIKRCKILLCILKRLWYCFADVQSSKNISSEKEAIDLKKCSIQPTGNVFLDHIIKRGEQILQDRSILYKTPIKSSVANGATYSIKNARKEIPLSRIMHSRKFSFINASAESPANLDFQLTDILYEMSNLSVTLSHTAE